MRLLLTGVGGSASTNFLDAVSLSGLRVSVVGTDSSAYMLSLAKVEHKYLVPRASEDSYTDVIHALVRGQKCDVIHAQPDVEVLRLSESRTSTAASMFLPSHDAIVLAGDKERFAKRMRESGIPVPISFSGSSEVEIYEKTSELLKTHEKLWVRARKGAGSRAALPISTAAQAINWIKWWIEEKNFVYGDFQVSEFLPGEEYALQTIWQNGRLIAAEARIRVNYLFGFLSPSGQSSSPSVARSTSNPAVYDVGINAIKSLQSTPNGVFCVDMKTNSAGSVVVTEINAGRFFTTSNFFAHAGVNMPEMTLRAAMGEQLSPTPIASLGDDLYWIRMMDMGYRLVHKDELEHQPGRS